MNLKPITVLKDEKLNDQWHRSFANQARAQDISDVLDITYTPLAVSTFDSKTAYRYFCFSFHWHCLLNYAAIICKRIGKEKSEGYSFKKREPACSRRS